MQLKPRAATGPGARGAGQSTRPPPVQRLVLIGGFCHLGNLYNRAKTHTCGQLWVAEVPWQSNEKGKQSLFST